MNFFIVRHETNLDIIGRFPQLEKMYDGFNAQHRYMAWGLYTSLRHTPMNKLSGMKLYSHAKPVDWIASSQYGTDTGLFSERFFNLLKMHNCMNFIAVPSEIISRKRTLEYQSLCFPETYNHFVDYKKSRFYLCSSKGWLSNIFFQDYNQYKMKQEELLESNAIASSSGNYESMINIRLLELHLNEEVVNLDFFRLTRISIDWIISKRLKEAIEKNKITGIKFLPAEGHIEPAIDNSTTPPREVR